MSVGTAKEKIGERQATEGKDGRMTYRRLYVVECTSRDDGATAVLNAVGLPGRGYVYSTTNETNHNAKVTTRSPRQVGPTVWEVEIVYEQPDPSQQTTGEGQPTASEMTSCWPATEKESASTCSE